MRARALLALSALVLLLGGCGSDTSGDTGSARDVIRQAAENPAKSADLDLSMELKLDGVEQLKDPVKVTVKGPTRSNGPRKLPDVDWKIHVEGAGKNADLRVTATGGDAWIGYGGQTYEVGTQLVSRFMSQAQAQSQSQPKLKLAVPGWLKDAEVSDGGRKVSGQLDVRKALADVNRITARLPQAHQIDAKTLDQIDGAVKDAGVEFQVGDDHILRNSHFNFEFEVPDELRSQAHGLTGGHLTLQTNQENVNGGQTVTAPSGARPLSELLQRFGVPPGALMGV